MIAAEFLERLSRRIDRIDQKELKTYVLDLIKEREFLMSLFDQLQQGMIVLNESGRIFFMNRRMSQLLDISYELGKKNDLTDIFKDVPLRNLIVNTIRKKNELYNYETEALLPRPMVLKITISFLENSGKKLAVLLIENISHNEIKAREQFKLENLETLTGLAAALAHEIGNPLNSLTIHFKLLEQQLKNCKIKEGKQFDKTLAIIQEETGRLDQIIRNFLRATRRKPIQYEMSQLNDTVQKIVEFLSPEFKNNNIKVKLDLEKNIPEFLIDPDRIQQVLLNLSKNAIHAMPKGGTLFVSTETRSKLCIVRFRDTGTGIAEENIQKIFDAYYTTKEEGSGLGLMIANQIIREHGGRIEVTSKIKQGTTFSITIPMRTEKLRLTGPKEKDESLV